MRVILLAVFLLLAALSGPAAAQPYRNDPDRRQSDRQGVGIGNSVSALSPACFWPEARR